MLRLDDIEFNYNKKGLPALSSVSADIHPGIHLLAGENGSGKTTLLRLISGLGTPSRGKCEINGVKVTSDCPSEMGRTFILEENMFFPGKNIRGFAKTHSLFYPKFSNELFESNLSAFGLTGEEDFKSLSLGNRKKSQLAYVLALGVDVLLLDEPTNALDIQSREVLRRLLAASVREDQTVIVATHTVSELENIYDGIMILSKSCLLYAGTEGEIADRLSFAVTRFPDSEALYSEIQVGRVLSIYPSEPDNPTKIDWRLLYSSLYSPRRDAILKVLHSPKIELK